MECNRHAHPVANVESFEFLAVEHQVIDDNFALVVRSRTNSLDSIFGQSVNSHQTAYEVGISAKLFKGSLKYEDALLLAYATPRLTCRARKLTAPY